MLNEHALRDYLRTRLPSDGGPISIEPIQGGQSNPTFRLRQGARSYVVRKQPEGELLPSAHAIDREYRVMTALRGTDVPVPRTYCYCDDRSVIGTPFFVMEFVAGRQFWDPALPELNRAERTLWMELGREPTLEEIAEEASLPVEQAREVRAAARASASLDQPVGEQEDAVFGDFVAGDEPLPEEHVEVSLRSQALMLALSSLPDRERQVLVLRYGLVDEEPKTLEEIGKRLGLTRERVRQIELESLRRLANLREMQLVASS